MHNVFVFSTLRDSLLILSQLFILHNYLFIMSARLLVGSANFRVNMDVDRAVSSAYFVQLNNFVALCRSLMYIVKSNGPRIDPCGTPVVILRVSNCVLL